ncbi:DUF2802 domain-containing protein [Marinobacteraceae bacterium S3BR75-40.1]
MPELMPFVPWLIMSAALVLLTLQCVAQRRKLSRLEHRLAERLEETGRELHAISSGSMGVGRRLMNCEKQLHRIQGQMEEMRHNDPLRVSYDEASRLVELGAEVDDLMGTCGISRPEAELVAALHRRKSGKAAH